MRRKLLWVGVGLLIALLVATPVVYQLTMSEAAKLDKLLPQVKEAFLRLKAAMAAKGHKLHVGQTLRTGAQQDAISADRTGTSNSWHEIGRALDVYVYDPDTGKPDLNGKRVDLYRLMHQEGSKIGFSNLAFNKDGSVRYITTKSGKKVWDGGHMEFREGMTWAQAAAKYKGVA